jgi:DNA-binding NarL/FixJ family response regulator
MSINIAIADDHPLVVSGLRNILPTYPHICLKGTYPNGMSLLAGLEMEQPDVLLLDIHLPDKTGDELVPLILKKYPDLKILTLTNFDSTIHVNTMFSHGVKGYILKSAENEDLIEAIEMVYRGEEFIAPSMREKMQHVAYKIKKAFSSKSTLTPREKEILQLVVDGSTNPEIAAKLFLSAKTVDNYRTNLMMKLEVNNAAALVKKALRLGLAE